MIDLLRREAVYLWYYASIQFEQIFQYWVLGVVLGSVISVFGKRRIYRLLTALQRKKIGPFGVIPASIIGIASPLCMYGTIPVAASFSEKTLTCTVDKTMLSLSQIALDNEGIWVFEKLN